MLFNLVEKLIELERRTHRSLARRLLRTRRAMRLRHWKQCRSLAASGAGWAIDHHIGMAMRGLSFTPAAPPRNPEHPDFLELRDQVDDHQLERDGAAARRDGKVLKPIELKTLLYNLLRANPGAFPFQVQHPLMEALAALDRREAVRFFQPASTAKKKRHRRLQLELWAYALVEYRVSAAGGYRRLAAKAMSPRRMASRWMPSGSGGKSCGRVWKA